MVIDIIIDLVKGAGEAFVNIGEIVLKLIKGFFVILPMAFQICSLRRIYFFQSALSCGG